MKMCPHCGAENADNSEYCSLCLARFNAAGSTQAAQQPQPEPYVSPGDYRALAQEMAQQNPQSGYRDSAYYHAAIQNPGAVSAIKPPAYMRKRSNADIAIMLLSYSFVTYLVLFGSRLLISMFLLGAAFGGSEAGFTFGIALLYIADALVLAMGGYALSAKAMHAGKGWLYGAACAACAVFIWQPLLSLIIVFLITGEAYIPIFNLVGILFTLFLELPMGALGGWIAEKRLMG